ncbi:hypothetical protein KKH15_02470 [Patescibacteria group bacterium]|nr:hypothetical protein [Patescibacteria group bacterium]MBU1755131.1 hypothetical protein [Patescibacteria group bacterium]
MRVYIALIGLILFGSVASAQEARVQERYVVRTFVKGLYHGAEVPMQSGLSPSPPLTEAEVLPYVLELLSPEQELAPYLVVEVCPERLAQGGPHTREHVELCTLYPEEENLQKRQPD